MPIPRYILYTLFGNLKNLFYQKIYLPNVFRVERINLILHSRFVNAEHASEKTPSR